MKTLNGLLALFVVLSFSFFAEAKINIKNTKRLILPIDVSEPLLSAETTQKLLPQSVSADDSGGKVASKIIDNTVSYWWDTSPIRQTSVGRAAEKVEKNLKAEVDLGKSENSQTEHKISIKLLAMQALARLEYKGWVRAGVNYDARSAKTEAELLESLAANKDLVLSQSFTNIESKSQVSLRWNW